MVRGGDMPAPLQVNCAGIIPLSGMLGLLTVRVATGPGMMSSRPRWRSTSTHAVAGRMTAANTINVHVSHRRFVAIGHLWGTLEPAEPLAIPGGARPGFMDYRALL